MSDREGVYKNGIESCFRFRGEGILWRGAVTMYVSIYLMW